MRCPCGVFETESCHSGHSGTDLPSWSSGNVVTATLLSFAPITFEICSVAAPLAQLSGWIFISGSAVPPGPTSERQTGRKTSPWLPPATTMPTNILKKTRNAWLEEKAKGIMATNVVLMPRKIAGPRLALSCTTREIC